MNGHAIRQLQAVQGYPSVSIFLPTHRSMPINTQDPILVKNLVKEAKERLLQEFHWRKIESLTTRLDQLVEGIDYEHLHNGLALFVNRDVAYAFPLPFAPQTRVQVDETFSTRDLFVALHHSQRYWVLALSEKPTRLFEGMGADLEEIINNDFPMTHSGPGGATALPGGKGINPSAHRDTRHRQFFQQVDTAFAAFTADDPLPLVLVGVDRYLAFFQEISAHTSSILTTITGNYDKVSAYELSQRIWPEVQEKLAEQRHQVMDELASAVNAQKSVSTIGEVWRLAQEGRGETLVVEEGFVYPARIDDTGLHLSPAADSTAPDVLDDAVDVVMDTVMAKGGNVVFVDDDTLPEHQRIALILRY